MADLTSVNTELASYVFASVGADGGWPDEVFPPDREAALGDQMVSLGEALQVRAQHRRLPIGAIRPAKPREHPDNEVAHGEVRQNGDGQGEGSHDNDAGG